MSLVVCASCVVAFLWLWSEFLRLYLLFCPPSLMINGNEFIE